jgi:GGDEF domain-containing protein
MGGDEFVVLAVNSLDPTGEVLLARLDQRLNARNTEPGRAYLLSTGRGIARFDPENPKNVDQLLDEADKRLMEGKRGRSR